MKTVPTILAALLLAPLAALHAADTMSLAGQWRFALDPKSEGIAAEWHKAALADVIELPGTTDEAGKGARKASTNFTSHLSRLYPFEGLAWYQRDVVIPEAWRGQRITLLLERTKFTNVWVDEIAFESQDSLATPQVRDLSAALTPGRHRLTILVDNNPKRWPINGGHQLSNHTQGNWNGILGRIELQATEPVWIEEVQVYPNVAAKSARLRVTVGNTTQRSGRGALTAEHGTSRRAVEISWDEKGAAADIELPLGADAKTWDEFAPNLEEIAVTLETTPAAPDDSRSFWPVRVPDARHAVRRQWPYDVPARQTRRVRLPADGPAANGSGGLGTCVHDCEGLRDQPLPVSFLVPAGGGV